MTCSEARQFIFAFLDNELDAALSLEVQQHLEHCPLCARECEIEHVVRKRLAHALQAVDDVPAFDEAAIAKLLRGDIRAPNVALPRAHRPYSWWVIRGSAAAVLALLAIAVVSRPNDGRRQSTSFADALVTDFEHFVSEQKPLQIESADREVVSRWFQERMALAIAMPDPDPSVGTLLGGRQCKINNVPAAFTIYRLGESLASVVTLSESEQALSWMQRIDRDGHTHWVDHCRGHTVVACRRGALIYAVVARLPEDVLTRLMPPTTG